MTSYSLIVLVIGSEQQNLHAWGSPWNHSSNGLEQGNCVFGAGVITTPLLSTTLFGTIKLDNLASMTSQSGTLQIELHIRIKYIKIESETPSPPPPPKKKKKKIKTERRGGGGGEVQKGDYWERKKSQELFLNVWIIPNSVDRMTMDNWFILIFNNRYI